MKALILFVSTTALLWTSFVFAEYNRDQAMTKVTANGIDIAYTLASSDSAPTVLLITGLSASHRLWDEDFVNGIVDAGYRVVLFDNRDTGESTRLDDLGNPSLLWLTVKATLGFAVDAPYSLNDMAADAIGLLNALNIERAHIVGASMGGMIAQIIAADYPQRAQSLVSIMSTTGASHLPRAQGDSQGGLLQVADTEGEMQAELEENGMFPSAMPRQVTAIVAAGDRSDKVSQISAPTLVIHGAQDNLMPKEHGQHTHELIKGSKFIVVEGMGHDLPPKVVPQIVQEMDQHFTSAGE